MMEIEKRDLPPFAKAIAAGEVFSGIETAKQGVEVYDAIVSALEQGKDVLSDDMLPKGVLVFEAHESLNEKDGLHYLANELETRALHAEHCFNELAGNDLKLPDGDYIAADGCIWLSVKNKHSIRVHSTDEGVAVDVYAKDFVTDDPIGSTYVYDSEADAVIEANRKADVMEDSLQWLILPNEAEATYTNWGDGRWGDASELVDQLNTNQVLNNGFTDWRLPTIDEIKTLIGTDQAPKNGWYWSSSGSANNHNLAWRSDFNIKGDGAVMHRSLNSRVRLVRNKLAVNNVPPDDGGWW